MHFYDLTYPNYETDQQLSRANPITMRVELNIPPVICPACNERTGGGYTSSDRVRVPVPETSALRPYLKGKRLPLSEWRGLVAKLREELSIPPWMPVSPGAQIGLPKGELRSARVPDFMHPFPGQMIVRRRVVDALESAGLTGFLPVRVEVTWGKRVKHRDAEPPELYELVVKGVAWRVGVGLDKITACAQCGRTVFPAVGHLTVDESRWDGSDFFHVDRNPNIVLVTERVCAVLASHGFSNYACVPIGRESGEA